MKEKSTGLRLLEATIGISIKVLSNEFEEAATNTYHKIVFRIDEEEPDRYAVGVLFAISLMSFTYAAPRGYSEHFFIPDEEWNLEYFVQGLKFQDGSICFSADYVSGRLMKTDIIFKSGGEVILSTRNRGKGADRWLTYLKGKKHISEV